MKLFDGHTLATEWKKADGTLTNATLPTLDELRAHVEATGRDALSWEDVSNYRNRDASGHVSVGASGSALILDMNPRFDAGHLHGFYDKDGDGIQNGDEASYATAAQVSKVDAAILAIDAEVKSLFGAGSSFGIDATTHKLTLFMATPPPGSPTNTLTGASALYPFVNFGDFSIKAEYAPGAAISETIHNAVGEILLASVGDHYIAGDGRVNENFGLTSIHHIFHEEHNYQIQNLMDAIHREDIISGDATHAKLHEFQIDAGFGTDPTTGDYLDAAGNISWDQDKMFLGAKLVVEMEYQHAAVDQYARNVSPNIQEFVGYSSSINSAVSLEYAQAAFRFGHSTLRETIDTIDPAHGLTGKIMGYALKEAFLSPEKYAAIGPAAVLLGMSHQQMNEVDEFITPALNQGLLGQPLDLAAINIARGRDVGIPTLNDFREAIGLSRYTSWTDFGQNLQHPTSLVNFIAAYSFDGDISKAEAIIGLVDGTITAGSDAAKGFTVAQAYAFVDGGDTGFNHIDTWLGGIAEIHQPGGLLGETFDKVFVNQIESLMDGDRFYYLFRLAGQQFAEEVGNGQLKDIVERNTGLTHLNGNIFGYADQYIDLGATKEVLVGTQTEYFTTGNEHKYGDISGVADGSIGIYSNGGLGNANDGHIRTVGGVDYIQDTRLANKDLTSAYGQNGFTNLDGTPNSGAESSEVIVGSKGNDLIYAQGGDDTVYGDSGNDIIYGGFGIDRLYGGDGADTIYGGDNPDLIDGGSGDDRLYGESSGSDINGSDQIVGGSGNDFISGGTGIDKLSGGSGDDKIYGDQDTDPFTHGGDGNDYVDGGTGGDILYGDNGDDVLVGGADQDQLFGGRGDDIIRPGDPTGALTIGTDEVLGGDGVNDEGNTPGTIGFDIVDFSDNSYRPDGVTFDLANQANPAVTVNGTPTQIATFQIEGVIGSLGNDKLTGDDGSNWLVGGAASDTLTGAGGNDVIIGGHIRLDTLIGRYESAPGVVSTYDHNNNNDGSTAALQLQDARYQGASQRVGYTDTLTAGLLGTAGFDKHFTEMLRSYQFKDTVLGDLGAAGTDTVVFAGIRADYTVEKITYASANEGFVTAYKITDSVAGRDGTDLIVGVQQFKFSDLTATGEAQLFNLPPVITSNGGGVSAVVAFAENGVLPVTTVQATDLTNTPLIYSISGTDAALFNINAATGVLTFKTAPNFEAPVDAGANNVYDIVVKVADQLSAFDTQTLAVTATNVDEAATGSLNIVNYQPRAIGANTVTLSATNTLGVDPDGVIVGTTHTHWQQLIGAVWTNVGVQDALTLSNVSNGSFRVVENYTDAAFGAKAIVSTETVIVGAGGAQTLNGTTGNDIVLGLGGVDTLNWSAGSDILDGGAGTDTASFATATPGQNVIVNLAANATVPGLVPTQLGAGTAVVAGSADVTYLVGIENVTGGAGNDTLTGDANANTLIGGAGNDVLNGGLGAADTLVGGLGDDTYVINNVGDVVTEAVGGGIDTVLSSLATYTLANNVENLMLTGTADINGTGNNFANTIYGNSGNNTLSGGTGADIMIGGAGSDTYIVDNINDVVTEGVNGGTDTVQSSVTFTLSDDVEILTLTGNGNTSGTGNTLDNVLTGNSGNNILSGGAGTDVINGGNGTDTSVYSGSVLDAVFGLSGTNLTVGTALDGLDTLNSIERVMFGVDAFNLFAANSNANTILTGVGNADLLIGFGGVDTLIGNAGADVLSGGGNNDSLSGGSGNDILIGGTGNDALTGGANNDTFVFAPGFGKDVITDFTAGTVTAHDVLQISMGTAFDTLAEILAAATQVGANTVINFDLNTSITLNGVTKASLVDADFKFM